MKKLLLLTLIFFTGCSLAGTDPATSVLYSGDITGDDVLEIVTIVESDVTVSEEFSETYPFTFNELYVESEDRTLLTIDSNGVTVENGDSVRAQVSTQAGYAIQLGEKDFMYVVQIDEFGSPVSEPLTINWDISTAGWKMK
ncbi:MAG: hypothetical protein Q8P90_01175 [bacterium]|nr:hypothetical protein [bacterium]